MNQEPKFAVPALECIVTLRASNEKVLFEASDRTGATSSALDGVRLTVHGQTIATFRDGFATCFATALRSGFQLRGGGESLACRSAL